MYACMYACMYVLSLFEAAKSAAKRRGRLSYDQTGLLSSEEGSYLRLIEIFVSLNSRLDSNKEEKKKKKKREQLKTC